MPITQTSIKRPVATAMVFLIVITLGMIGFRELPVDLLPPIEFPQLTVYVNYDNVGPEEMERLVTERVENALAGIPNVERISSNSSEGNSRVTLNFRQGINLDEATNDLRAALDRLRSALPEEASPPGIWKFDPNDSPVVVLGARSSMDIAKLTRLIERDLAKRFEQIPGVGSIDVWGGVSYEVRVEMLRDRMASAELTAQDVVAAISAENTNQPGGNVKDGLSDLYIRTLGEYETVEDIANTVIRVVEGAPIRVRDVANVSYDYQDIGRFIEVNDLPMVRFGIRKQTGANTVDVSNQVLKEVELINSMREDLDLIVIRDQSVFIQDSINNVRNSAVWGGILAVIVLFAFLRNGSTVLVIAVSIPISIIATFALMYFGGITLNQMSFGGLALGVGMIVDNAIVVLENIVRARLGKHGRKEAAIIGTKEVTGAVIASTITTCVVFLPVVFMQNVMGILFQELATVVVFALICSLLVALTLVPMLASRFMSVNVDADGNEVQTRTQKMFSRLENRYEILLTKALQNKKTIVFGALGLLMISVYGVRTISVELAPQSEADEIRIRMRMDDGTNISVVREYLEELDGIVREIIPPNVVKYYSTELRNGQGEIELALLPLSDLSISPNALTDQIRDRITGTIPGAEIDVRAQSGMWIFRRIFGSGGGDEALQLQIRGYDLETSAELARQVVSRIEPLPGIVDARVGERDGRPEQRIKLDRERIAQLGLSSRQVATAIQTNVGGSRAGYYRIDGDEIPINVRLRPEDRRNLLDLDNISIKLPTGQVIPISTVISSEAGRGPTNISRVNSQRVTYITANLETGVPIGDAVGRVQAALVGMDFPEGYSVYFGGEYEEQQKAQADFNLAIFMALALIYMVMAAQFERFLDPLIVMFSVPLALIGIAPVMLLTGTTLNMQSLMGVVMLVGIVVNNAILIVDYINLMRREKGLPLLEAVIAAGKLRLRPILMTTLTTVLGLLPLSFGIGSGGELQASLARVVIGGLTASTLITLVFIPVVYVTLTSRVEQWRENRVKALSPQAIAFSESTR
jgi:HAE1 family hydrophobic/amphiphilic exporter-1